MPGIMGSSDGNINVSAGIFAKGDSNTANSPMTDDAIADAGTMLICPSSGDISRKRMEWPVAAIKAQKI